MAYAIKTDTKVRAWELGADSDMEKELILCGRIVAHPDGTYELFTLETQDGKGQRASAGDYFKVDGRGFPHPNERSFFLREHRRLEGDWYEQAARPLKIWRRGDPPCEELRFLLDSGILQLHPEDPQRFFSAFLWATEETAASDAVVVFFAVEKDPEGKISGIRFNFVDNGYFRKNYRVIES